MVAGGGGELFDGVAEHCAGHRGRVEVEEGEELGEASVLADFAEHPARGLVDEVVGMAEKALGDAERGVVDSRTDEAPVRDDPYPLMPESAVHGGELVEEGNFVWVECEPVAEDFRGYHVDEVPVVSAVDDGKVVVDNHPESAEVAALLEAVVDFDKQEESGEAELVILGIEEWLDVGKLHAALVFLSQGARERHTHPEKAVALAVLAGGGLEEAHEMPRLGLVGHTLHPCRYVVGYAHFAIFLQRYEKSGQNLQHISFFLEGDDGKSRVGQEAADVGNLDIEREGVGIACVSPYFFEYCLALHRAPDASDKHLKNLRLPDGKRMTFAPVGQRQEIRAEDGVADGVFDVLIDSQAPEALVNLGDELLGVERFWDVVVAFEGKTVQTVHLVCPVRKEEYYHTSVGPADYTRHLEAVKARHVDVEKDKVRTDRPV